jgi:nucleoside-diphosphate-sugar epimerase
MKTLFLGGPGNISSDCAALLYQRGHEVTILNRGRVPVPSEYKWIRADRKDLAAMRAAVAGVKPEVVLNFIGFEVPELEVDYELFKGAIQQYIFISSATVYSKPPRQVPITEDAPLGNPWWDYAQKKVECENYLQKLRKETGFPVTIVRPSHTYSKHWIPNPVASSNYAFASRLEQGKPVFVPDNGENPWTLTATSDFAVGLCGLAGKPEAVREAFHITSDEALTWNQICAEIASAVGATSPTILKIPTDFICEIVPELTGNLKGDKSHPGVFDNSRIKKFVPEYQCRKPFRQGIREAVAWLRAHPDERRVDAHTDEIIEKVVTAWQRRSGSS